MLCRVDDIPEGGALAVDTAHERLVLVRSGATVRAYRNRCPHFSVPLDFHKGRIHTYGGAVLMCAHHSAMFRFSDGLCIDGPCEGARLDARPVRVADDGRVLLAG